MNHTTHNENLPLDLDSVFCPEIIKARPERSIGIRQQRNAQRAAAGTPESRDSKSACADLARSYFDGRWDGCPAAQNELHGLYWLHRAAEAGDANARIEFERRSRGPLAPPLAVFLPAEEGIPPCDTGMLFELQPPETAHPRLHYLRRWGGGEARVKVNRFLPDSVMPDYDERDALAYARNLLQDNEGIVDGGLFHSPSGQCVWGIFKRRAYDEEMRTEYDLQAYFHQRRERPWRVAATFRPTAFAAERELVGRMMLERDSGRRLPEHPHSGIGEDPFDPSVRSGFLRTPMEDASLDGRFPGDPLTEARRLVDWFGDH